METPWRPPGLRSSLLYALAATIISSVLSAVSRLEITRRASPTARLPEGPVIVIANHTSFADGLVLALVGRRLGRSLRLMATGGVFRHSLVGPLVRRLGFIPVLRGTATAADSLAAAEAALGLGEAVGLFPEGRLTRDPDGWPERAKTGMVRLALATGAPIVPLAMVGADRVIGRRGIVARLVRNALFRPLVQVQVGPAIDVRRLVGSGEPDDATIRRVTDEVMSELVALVAELRGEPAPHPAGVPEEALLPRGE